MHLKIFFYLSILIFSIPNHSNEIEYEFPALTKFLEKEVKKGRYPGFLTYIKKNGNLIPQSITYGFKKIRK